MNRQLEGKFTVTLADMTKTEPKSKKCRLAKPHSRLTIQSLPPTDTDSEEEKWTTDSKASEDETMDPERELEHILQHRDSCRDKESQCGPQREAAVAERDGKDHS
ncbi:hypothetical protein ABVT39_014848 [Epinephelus coioides]